jgi:hypothetical protein
MQGPRVQHGWRSPSNFAMKMLRAAGRIPTLEPAGDQQRIEKWVRRILGLTTHQSIVRHTSAWSLLPHANNSKKRRTTPAVDRLVGRLFGSQAV